MFIRYLKSLFWFGFSASVFFVAFAAIAGLLAFAIWPMDPFNHFQPVILPLSFVGFLISAIFAYRQPFRGLMLTICATGFAASTLVVVPEVVGALTAPKNVVTDDDSMRLMTFNIYAKNDDYDALFEAIEKENPDFLLVQEYWREHREELSPRIEKLLPNFIFCQGGKRSFLAIYSRFPISETTGHDCNEEISNGQRHSIISVKVEAEIPFNLVTTHFDWPIPADRQFEQMRKVASSLNSIEGPLLIGGDFNSTPFSYTHKNFVKNTGLTRAVWLTPTWPAPPTYPIDMPPWLQLDHILYRGDFVVSEPRRGENGGSDHFPLIVDFKLTENSSQ